MDSESVTSERWEVVLFTSFCTRNLHSFIIEKYFLIKKSALVLNLIKKDTTILRQPSELVR